MPEEIDSTPVENTPEVTKVPKTTKPVSKVEEPVAETADEEFQKWWRREQM